MTEESIQLEDQDITNSDDFIHVESIGYDIFIM